MILLDAWGSSIAINGNIGKSNSLVMPSNTSILIQGKGKHQWGAITSPLPRITPLCITPNNNVVHIYEIVDDGFGNAQFETSTAHEFLPGYVVQLVDAGEYYGLVTVTSTPGFTTFVANTPYIGNRTGSCVQSCDATISGVSDNGAGKALFATTTPHGKKEGSRVSIEGTILYDGNHTVTVAVDTQHFETGQPYLGTATGTSSDSMLVPVGSLVFSETAGVHQIRLPALLGYTTPYAFNEYGHAIWISFPTAQSYFIVEGVFIKDMCMCVARNGHWDIVRTSLEIAI
jgi:hypothetical protein